MHGYQWMKGIFKLYLLQSQAIILLVKAMKYPSESAVQNHYLQSILPHPIQQPKQFLKNRDFYKPEKFIWNNPHRASDQMYKFYHAYNDHYFKHKQPLIRQQEEKDRQEVEMKRIHRLIAFRNKAREQFFEKQRSREILQSRLKNESIPATYAVRTDPTITPMDTKYKSQSTINNQKFKLTKTPNKIQHSQRVLRIEDTYKAGVKKYDVKVDQINKLIEEQNEEFHNKVRSQFAVRKKTNDITNSKFFPLKKQRAQMSGLSYKDLTSP